MQRKFKFYVFILESVSLIMFYHCVFREQIEDLQTTLAKERQEKSKAANNYKTALGQLKKEMVRIKLQFICVLSID